MQIKEVIGYTFYSVAKWLPSSESRIFGAFNKSVRQFFARMYCHSVGNKVNIDRNVTLGQNLYIGDRSGIGRNSVIQGTVEIGKDVMIGPGLYVFTTNHRFDRLDVAMIDQGFQTEKKVVIGDNVWIGARVIILPGVIIGNGSIIGAGSVVTKNIFDNTIAAGNPAKSISLRSNGEGKNEDIDIFVDISQRV